MRTTSSLGKTPKTHRWVTLPSGHRGQFYLSINSPRLSHSWSLPELSEAHVRKEQQSFPGGQPVRSRGGREEVSEKNESVRETQRRTLNTQVMAKTLSLFPEPRRPRYASFLQANPCCATQLRLGFCHLPSITLTAFPFLAGNSFRVYNTFNYRMVFVSILSVTSGRNLAQIG